MAKPGLEGHWRGLISVSQAFKDAGFEVIYGASMPPAEIAETALQEDVDIVGLSILCSNYMELVTEVMKALKAKKKDDVFVLLGGIIYEEDFAALHKMGVDSIYHSRHSPGRHRGLGTPAHCQGEEGRKIGTGRGRRSLPPACGPGWRSRLSIGQAEGYGLACPFPFPVFRPGRRSRPRAPKRSEV